MKYKDKPGSAGYYWLKNIMSAAPARIVEVWGYVVGGALFTNDDGGASLDDEAYKNHVWLGPLKEPHFIFGDESAVCDVINTGDAHKKGTVLSSAVPGQAFEPQD